VRDLKSIFAPGIVLVSEDDSGASGRKEEMLAQHLKECCAEFLLEPKPTANGGLLWDLKLL